MTDHFCEEFKRVLSMPNLHGSQSQSVGAFPMHNNPLPPALPSRQQLHAAPPPIPPRTNNVMSRGMRTTNENPYAPLPAGIGIEQAVMQSRRQQPRLQPRQHPDYDALPLPIHARGHIPQPHTGRYHHYTNIPNG